MPKQRVWEIDIIRVIALVLMIAFHLAYDLREFAGFNIDYNSSFWFYLGKTSALMFIFVSGLSCGFSRNPLKRGVKIFTAGMLITLITYFWLGKTYVRFGILHFLGATMIFYPLLRVLSNGVLLGISLLIVALSTLTTNLREGSGLFLPLGIRYEGFTTIDYYPLFPYLAVSILGMIIYKKFYGDKKTVLRSNYNFKHIKVISEKSLPIYLIHQPVLVGLIDLFKWLHT